MALASRRSALTGVLWLLVILAALLLYLPGLGGTFHFDDRSNLEWLSQASTLGSALVHAAYGDAGPLGRPLALLTFWLQADAWPDDPQRFLAFNVVLHLLNGLLIGLFAYQVARLSPHFPYRDRARWIALITAATWLFLPLLASSNLFIIQRMTTLAAFFVLLGLCLHLWGRRLIVQHTHGALTLMTAGTAVGLGLGVLSKENAALYPLIVLTLDRTLLQTLERPPAYRRWRWVFVIVPASLVLLYLLSRLISGGGYEARNFDVTERLMTQGIVLFDYLRLMLLPSSSLLGPFHDQYPLFGGWPLWVAVLAVDFWICAGAAALIFAPRAPILAFSTLWFLGCHLIESTWVPLELYFEHRNYLPAVGVILGLVLMLGRFQGRSGRMAYLGLSAYALTLAFGLFQVTSLWGSPATAAELWWTRNPDSLRAAQFLANYHTREGSPLTAARVLEKTSERSPLHITLQINAMELRCLAGDKDGTKALYERVLRRAPRARYRNLGPDTDARHIQRLLNRIQEGECPYINYRDIRALTQAYLSNPLVIERAETVRNYHLIQSRVAAALGNGDKRLSHLLKALDHSPVLHAAMQATVIAAQRGEVQRLQRVGRIVSDNKPVHPLKRQQWEALLVQIRQAVEVLKKHQTAPKA